jgi:hypothetical protein
VAVLACALLPAWAGSSAWAAKPDTDSDGLSDRYEIEKSGTNPREKDTDGDGISDGKEVRRFKTKPRRKDTDRDGLDDRRELRKYKTNPRRKDTDRDRLNDWREVRKYKTNPRKADTDGDGLSDWRELRKYKTKPRKRDTDRDGLSDGIEVRLFKTSARRGDTDRDGVPDGVEVLRGRSPLVAGAGPGRGGSGGGGSTGGGTGGGSTGGGSSGGGLRPCSRVVSSLAGVRSAVAGASAGAVVCLSDGTYGRLDLDASPSATVTIRAQNPGRATITGATLDGRNLTLARFRVAGDEIRVQPGSDHITIANNLITGGYFGVNAGPTTTTTVNDVTVTGNKFQGPFGEDGIRANRYHDGPDADPYGLRIIGNEFTNIRENGNHSDCLQTVWTGDGLYFEQNYLHDNRCQGFFIKDQTAGGGGEGVKGPVRNVVADDNLMVRNDADCVPASLCAGNGGPAIVDVFGPIAGFRFSDNTVWTLGEAGNASVWQSGGWTGTQRITGNVLYQVYGTPSGQSDQYVPSSSYSASGNLACDGPLETFPRTGFASRCSPAFNDPARDDYRILSGADNGKGVSWAPAQRKYGP